MSDDVLVRAREALDERDRPTTTGHGHVRPRIDGNRSRCGGPRICTVCQQEAARTPDPWTLVRDLLREINDLRTMLDTDNLVDAVERAQGETDDALARAAEAERCASRLRSSAVRYNQKRLDAETERDRLRATIARVEGALAGHPTCDTHPDDAPVTCGWKHAVADVQRALDGEAQG